MSPMVTPALIGRSGDLPRYPNGIYGGHFAEGAWRSPLLTYLMQTRGLSYSALDETVQVQFLRYGEEKPVRRTYGLMEFRDDFGREHEPWLRSTIRMREQIESSLLYAPSPEPGVRRGLIEHALPLDHSIEAYIATKGDGPVELWLCGTGAMKRLPKERVRVFTLAQSWYGFSVFGIDSGKGESDAKRTVAIVMWEPAFRPEHRDCVLILDPRAIRLRHTGADAVHLHGDRRFARRSVTFFASQCVAQNTWDAYLWRVAP